MLVHQVIQNCKRDQWDDSSENVSRYIDVSQYVDFIVPELSDVQSGFGFPVFARILVNHAQVVDVC